MNKLLRNAECVKEISDNMELYAFMYQRPDDGQRVISLWSLSEPDTVCLNLGCNEATVYDWYGNSKKVMGEDGNFVFSVGEEPIYIEGNFTDAQLREKLIDLSTKKIVMAADDISDIAVKGVKEKGYDINVTLTDGIKLEKRKTVYSA